MQQSRCYRAHFCCWKSWYSEQPFVSITSWLQSSLVTFREIGEPSHANEFVPDKLCGAIFINSVHGEISESSERVKCVYVLVTRNGQQLFKKCICFVINVHYIQ